MLLKSIIVIFISLGLAGCIFTYVPSHPLFTEYQETYDYEHQKYDVLKENDTLFYIVAGMFESERILTIGLYYDTPNPKNVFLTKVDLIVNGKVASTIRNPAPFREKTSFYNKQYMQGGARLIFDDILKTELLREELSLQIYFKDSKGKAYTINLPFEFKLVMQTA